MAIVFFGLLWLPGLAGGQTASAPSPDAAPSLGLLSLVDEEVWQPREEVAGPRDTSDQPLRRPPTPPAQEQVIGERADGAAAGGSSWWRTILSLGLVVGLIVLLAWGYRAMGQAGGRLGLLGKARQPYLMDIVARTPISPKQSLCLVRIGPRLLVVGVSPENLSTLDVIADEQLAARLLGQAQQSRSDSQSNAFAATLDAEAGAYAVDEEATPWDEHDAAAASAEPAPAWANLLDQLRSRLRQAS